MLRMVVCRVSGELGVGLAVLVRGVFYGGGGVYVRGRILNGYSCVVADVGLICLFGGLGARLRWMGACWSWRVIGGCGAVLVFGPCLGEVWDFGLCWGGVFEVGSRLFLVVCPDDSGYGPLFVVGEDGRGRSFVGYEGGLASVVWFLGWCVVLACGG